MEKRNTFLEINDIKKIQLDHTSRCNLFCPQCARTVNKKYPITDLTIDDYKIILEPFDTSKLSLFHCGNYGDALASPTFDSTFDYCLASGISRIKISTNGSLRTPDWWKELALKSKGRLMVVFSIDGLEDTNHIYRVGSKFSKIMSNAKSFIDNGGYAEWAFIEFKHNYHQIDAARQRSKDMGFKHFSIKYTARFAENDLIKVRTKNNNDVEDTDRNHIKKNKDLVVEKYKSFDDYVMNTPISCKFRKEQTMFIDMTMNLWPCCWLGGPTYFENKSTQSKSFDHLFGIYGKDFNNLRIHGWEKVLSHEFYTAYLEESWNNPTDRFQRIYTCGRTCGTDFEFSSGYGKNYKRENIDDR